MGPPPPTNIAPPVTDTLQQLVPRFATPPAGLELSTPPAGGAPLQTSSGPAPTVTVAPSIHRMDLTLGSPAALPQRPPAHPTRAFS